MLSGQTYKRFQLFTQCTVIMASWNAPWTTILNFRSIRRFEWRCSAVFVCRTSSTKRHICATCVFVCSLYLFKYLHKLYLSDFICFLNQLPTSYHYERFDTIERIRKRLKWKIRKLHGDKRLKRRSRENDKVYKSFAL